MSLLDGGIAGIMNSAFGGIYLPATLYRRSWTDDKGTLTENAPATESIRCQVDAATEAMRAQAGYTGTDVRLLILAAAIDPIDTDCEVAVGNRRFAIASVDQDPAGAYFECRGVAK